MNTKNIALVGHHGSGKTMLASALVYRSGLSDRLTPELFDSDSQEARIQSSLSLAVASFTREGENYSLIDTPGSLELIADMYAGLALCDTAMITVSAKSGVKVGTKKAYQMARNLGKSTMLVVTKIDDGEANFYNTLTELKTTFGPSVCPVVVPVLDNGKITSYVNLIEMKSYRYDAKGNAIESEITPDELGDKEYRLGGLVEAVSEAVAETSDTLMEKFFEGETFTQKELIDGIHDGMNRGLITPVVCTSALTGVGVDMLLKEMQLLVPSAEEVLSCKEDNPLCSVICKTFADPFVGKLSYIKVLNGTLQADSSVRNSRTCENEKIGKLYSMFGKKQTELASAQAGQIVTCAKLTAQSGDVLFVQEADPSSVVFPDYPKPCYHMAVTPKVQGEEGRLSGAITRLVEEDPSLCFTQDPSTKEQILSGLGAQHLELAVERLERKLGVKVSLAKPQTAYRETIRKKVQVEGKHKKQSGGHGQYGHVVIAFEPVVSDTLVFEERVFGGAVPKNYFPAVEKGLQESMKKGVLSGCPVVGMKAILLDGSYHPVDSSEMAFKTAASIAFKEGMRQADPVLLEPIHTLEVNIPNENTGDIMGELNKRRGRVLGMNPLDEGDTQIVAEVPVRQMHDFALYLNQVTKGMGNFAMSFARFEPLPTALLPEVLTEIAVHME